MLAIHGWMLSRQRPRADSLHAQIPPSTTAAPDWSLGEATEGKHGKRRKSKTQVCSGTSSLTPTFCPPGSSPLKVGFLGPPEPMCGFMVNEEVYDVE